MSEALYRKYRPQTFEDVVGQTHIERTLKNAIEQDKVGHAYLFCGPRGTGKTTTARLLAKALLCEKGPTPAPDGSCEQCEAIAAGIHPDVYELDAASRTGVDNVREEIIGRVQYAPTRGRYKVYIIDEVHMLSIAAFNALLKTLEEPPSHVVFIMCTTDPQKVPETIQSRCQRFDFHRLSKEEIISRLGAVCTAEGVNFEGDALDLVAHRAQGGMRDALTMLEQLIAFGDGEVTVEVANDVLGSLDVDDMSDIVRHIAQRDAAACFTWVSEYVETGADLAHFVRDLATYVRDLYVLTLTDGAVAVNAPQNALARMTGEARMFGVDRLAYILRVLGDLNTELRTSTNPRLSFEIGLTRMVRPQSDLTLESLAARVEVLERALAQGDFVSKANSSAPQAASPEPRANAAAAIPASANSGYRALQGQVSQGQPAAVQPKPTASSAAPAHDAPRASDKAAEFRAQLEQRQARRASAQTPQPAPAPQAAPRTTTAAALQGSPACAAAPTAQGLQPVSDDVKAKISNPAALQRGWQTALADLKRQRAAYGALLLSARFVAAPDASGVFIEFSPENSFAYSAAQKPDISAALEQALSSAFGGFVPFRITQGNSAGAAPVSAAASAAPAAYARVAPAPSRVAEPNDQVRRPAPQAAANEQPQAAPPWEDEVVPYTDADIAAYVSQDESRPFPDPDASQSAGAPSHREQASQASDAPVAGVPSLIREETAKEGSALAKGGESSAEKSNPFANRKMPEGIGKHPNVASASSTSGVAVSAPELAKPKAKSAAKGKMPKVDELAAAVAQFGDAMLVVGATPVDPYPVAVEMGFDSAFDPKLKAKNLAKPKGWPMPADARLLESGEASKVSAAGEPGDAVASHSDGATEPRDRTVSQEPAAQPEPVFAVDSESASPKPDSSAFERPNPFANRAMPKGADSHPSQIDDEPSRVSDGSSEMSAEEIFKAFGVRPSEIVEQR